MISRASAVWEGDGLSGKGTVTGATGAFRSLPVSWKARAESSGGMTSPEEMLASAHAACYAMALSFGLSGAKTPPTKLEVSCAVTFEKAGAGFKVTRSELEVRGTVPGSDAAAFEKAAAAAKDGCPVSQAFKGNVEISLKATLAK